jgi:beta-glucosidase/6-phospho-beta-glucosidase/beta-galactosidase
VSGLKPLEVWAGLECSRVRIADDFRDQIADTGHRNRPDDIDLIADLGIQTLRYPVLWETVCGVAGKPDWRWHDARLGQLRRAGISPIVGLVHHGSGPNYCNVLDPAFPQSLANFAADVAQRYPWVESFTPINEPMTTARLCGLYGHWYPHGRDEATCFRVVVAECRAIAASMKEIRRSTSNAQLVQTEDVGRVFATPLLQYQADYENERRWLALDLLCGKVDSGHAFYRRLLDQGIEERHLAELVDDPCPPDVAGIDHYLTSDRFLDECLVRQPGEAPGGNGRHIYVDVAAARADVTEEEIGFLTRIREVWDRYRLPIALTEVHNGCTREEQLRWLMDGWNAANSAREMGIDLCAVSVWSLFGATDWNSLLTRREGFYEPGAFDTRFDPPRPTVIASAIRALVCSGRFGHPVLARRGWWKPDERSARAHSLIVTGSQGLDRLLADCCAARRLDIAGLTSQSALGNGTWATIHADIGFRTEKSGARKPRPLSLTCRYLTEKCINSLIVEAGHSLDPAQVIHAFLDLVIDGVPGHFRITSAGRSRQYAFEPLGQEDCQTTSSNIMARTA